MLSAIRFTWADTGRGDCLRGNSVMVAWLRRRNVTTGAELDDHPKSRTVQYYDCITC